MAAFSQFHPLHITHSHPVQPNTAMSRSRCFSVSCHGQLQTNMEKKGKNKEEKGWSTTALMKLFREAGKGIKVSLSPKQKGDWKDLVLMSFSFAIYIYISQRIVCAYCAWMSMINHA